MPELSERKVPGCGVGACGCACVCVRVCMCVWVGVSVRVRVRVGVHVRVGVRVRVRVGVRPLGLGPSRPVRLQTWQPGLLNTSRVRAGVCCVSVCPSRSTKRQ